jgi:hypothetical protein
MTDSKLTQIESKNLNLTMFQLHHSLIWSFQNKGGLAP